MQFCMVAWVSTFLPSWLTFSSHHPFQEHEDFRGFPSFQRFMEDCCNMERNVWHAVYEGNSYVGSVRLQPQLVLVKSDLFCIRFARIMVPLDL